MTVGEAPQMTARKARQRMTRGDGDYVHLSPSPNSYRSLSDVDKFVGANLNLIKVRGFRNQACPALLNQLL